MEPMHRRLISESPSLLGRAAQARAYEPLVLRDVGPPKFTIFGAKDLLKLHVDERYQRWEIRELVNEIIHVLRSGGSVIEPIVVSYRPDGTLWIVDGQQRWWAHYECDEPIKAVVYDMDYDQEVLAFQILNTERRRVTSDHIVRSWSGASAKLIKWFADSSQSPQIGMIDMSGRHKTLPYNATQLLRVLHIGLTGSVKITGGVGPAMRRADREMSRPDGEDRARKLLELVFRAFPPLGNRRVQLSPMVALAVVAHDRWNDGPVALPPADVLLRLCETNWALLSKDLVATEAVAPLRRYVEGLWRK